MTAAELLRRPETSYQETRELVTAMREAPSQLCWTEPRCALPELDDRTATEVEMELKYAGYIRREQQSVERARKQEERLLPETLDYRTLPGLRTEARAQLERVRPRTLGQASRLPGVTPADISILLVQIERLRRDKVSIPAERG